MLAKRSGFRGWLYRRTPRLITATGYVIGISVLLAAAATIVISTTIMVSAAGTITPNVQWLSAEGPAIVRHLEASPGASVEAGDALVRLIDTPEQVARAHYLQQLEEGLNALAADTDALPNEAIANIRDVMDAQAARIGERVLHAPMTGWAVLPEADNALAPGQPVAAGDPLTGVANLDHATLQLSATVARPPTARVGDHVSLLLADWSAPDQKARVETIQTIAAFEAPRSALDPTQVESLESTPEGTLFLLDERCPVQAIVSRDSVTLNVTVDALSEPKAAELSSGRSYTLALQPSDSGKFKARLNTLQVQMTLSLPGEGLPESIRQALRIEIEKGHTEQPVAQAWVGLRRTSLFSRLFGK